MILLKFDVHCDSTKHVAIFVYVHLLDRYKSHFFFQKKF